MKRQSLKKIAVVLVFIIPLLVVLLQKKPLRADSNVQIIYRNPGVALNYKIGETYEGQGGEDYSGESGYVDTASTVAMDALSLQNRHATSSFGMPNLWSDPLNRNTSSWLWENLDKSITSLKNAKGTSGLGAETMITLGMAPAWMTTHQAKQNPNYPAYSNWTNYPGSSVGDSNSKYSANPARGDNSITTNTIEASVDPWFEDDFAYMAAKIAERYPDVNTFQIWNEMKGYYKPDSNRWDYEQYTSFYNKVYAAVKAVRPSSKIGGPYVVMGSWADPSIASHPTNIAACKGSWGVFDQRDIDVIQFWLANKSGADFINLSIDTRANTKSGTNVESTYDEFNVKAKITTLQTCLQYLKQQSPNQADRSLPIYISEFYPIANTKANLNLAHANAVVANALGETVNTGFDTVMLWDMMSSDCDFTPNLDSQVLLSLMNSTRCSEPSQKGIASPLASTTGQIKRIFGAGTNLLAPQFDESKIGVFASTKGIMLVNKKGESQPTSINGCLITLGAYQVKFTDLLDCNKPQAPTNLNAQDIGKNISLSWDESSDAESLIKYYYVYREDNSGSIQKIAQLNKDARTYTDSYSGSTSVNYKYYITTEDSFGNESDKSNIKNVVITIASNNSGDGDTTNNNSGASSNNSSTGGSSQTNLSTQPSSVTISSPKTGLSLDIIRFIVPIVVILVLISGAYLHKKRLNSSPK